ncbi:hypothetical protein AQUCO_09600021v1 [Aquilegia coerulea]|uniref:Uncharacterized protein n=2 Tax=Aquilegia coerulea TaxID=218851 RepID=A0A2G5C4K8_AQUCA|nr:hypothetical protein AQUCO_09600021v1 [Aquilegia coerulea]
MAPKNKPTGSPSPKMNTRNASRLTRSAAASSKSARFMTLEDLPKKKRVRKSSSETASKKQKVDAEEEQGSETLAEDTTVKEEEEEEEEEDTESKITTAADGDSAVKTIEIEHCTQNKTFKETATAVKDALEKAIPGIKVLLNPEKPRRGCFEVREGGEPFVSLLDMKKPFQQMKDLDMEKVVTDALEKITGPEV